MQVYECAINTGVNDMAHLSKLKFSDKQRSQVKMTVEERLRHKLIDRLKEQKGTRGSGPEWRTAGQDAVQVHQG